MRGFTDLKGSGFRSIHGLLEGLLLWLSFYAIPVAIGLVSLTALIFWDDGFDAAPEKQLQIRSLILADEALSPNDALSRLATVRARTYFDTELSEAPVWFSFKVDRLPPSTVAEFPSRHATDLSCWDAGSLQLLGHASGRLTDGQLNLVKSGYALDLTGTVTEVLCRAHFVGPARLTVLAWTADQLTHSAQEFQRKAGLFEGGLLLLSAFVLLTALINRQRLYVIFGVWLLIGLRVGATSGGWDTQWLHHVIPTAWLSSLRSITLASYALLTLTLYRSMFQADLEHTRFASAIKFAHWLCLPLLVLAIVLPRGLFIPTVWFFAGPGLVVMTLSLLTIVVKTRSHVAIWYGASLAVTFLSSFSEILAAAYGLKGLLAAFNSVTAALASSLLASIAIAEQIRQEHQQRLAAQAELQHTFDVMPIGLFTLDLQGRFLSANPAMHKMLGRYVLRSGRNTWGQYFNHGSWTALHQLLIERQEAEIEVRSSDTLHPEQPRRYLVKATLAGDKIEGSLQDITEKSLAAEEMSFLADNDSLTKVLNRRGIEEVFNRAMGQMHEDRPLAMAYLDLDRFKLINDLYGHNTGDDILRQVCERVKLLLSGGMSMGRIGGDEFVVLLPESRMTLATVICRGILETIDSKPFRVGDKAFHVRGSIGLIEVSRDTSLKDAISTADRACREAKTGQRKGLVVYERDAPAFREHEAEIRLAQRLASGEALQELYLVMQPIMSLTRPNDTLNFEVLLRMHEQDGETVPLSRLITAAEHSGRMSMIDRWVLATTLAWLDRHRARLLRTQFVCVNLSGSSLNDEDFMEEVFDMLRSNSHVASFLSIEITESVALHDLTNTRRFINKVRAYGARVALDDFGAGYSSFAYIKELPADLLKIDGSFIATLNQHPANVSIVETIVNLARNLGMKTVAEWAEDTDTVETLAEIGVDYVQGYVVSHPQLPDKLLEAASAASFIQDGRLLHLVSQMGLPDDPLGKVDMVLQNGDIMPPKIH